jgi:Tfp pilus assembly protein PilF
MGGNGMRKGRPSPMPPASNQPGAEAGTKGNRGRPPRQTLSRLVVISVGAAGLAVLIVAGVVMYLRIQSTASQSPLNSQTGGGTNAMESVAPPGSAQTTTNQVGPPEAPDDPVELFKRGTEYLVKGEAAKSIPLFLKARQINPDDEEVNFNLGYAFSRLGRTNEAIQCYTESLRIYPDYVEAHNNLGNLYVGLREYDKATEQFTAALRVTPDHAAALNNLGKCLAAQGKTEESIAQFSQALQVDPSYLEARYNLGIAFLTLGKPDEAIAEFKELLKLEPRFSPAAAALSRAEAIKAAVRKTPPP